MPVLTVEVDTGKIENIWIVFRHASSLKEGPRLENLSWRLWNQETLCSSPDSVEHALWKIVSIIRDGKGLRSLGVPPLDERPQPKPQRAPALVPTPKIPIGMASTSVSSSGTSERSTTCVVRGFTPGHASSSYRTKPLLRAPSSIPTADIAAAENPKPTVMKKSSVFALPSSSTDELSSEPAGSMGRNAQSPLKRNPAFIFSSSSNEDEASLPSR